MRAFRVPILFNGQVGAGGGSGDQDAEVAKASIVALLAERGAEK